LPQLLQEVKVYNFQSGQIKFGLEVIVACIVRATKSYKWRFSGTYYASFLKIST